MKNNELPEGWEVVAISSAFLFNPGHAGLDLSDDAEVSFVPMTDIGEETGLINLTSTKLYCEAKKGYTKFIEGDVLFAKITPCMENGKVAIATGLVNGLGCGTTEVHVFRSKGLFLPKLLYYYLVQKSFRDYAKSQFNGAVGHLRVPNRVFDEKTLPLPPLAEQRRIVAKLDALMAQLDSSRARLERVPALLKRFRQAVLAAAVSGRLTEAWRAQQPDGAETAKSLAFPTATFSIDEQSVYPAIPASWQYVRLGDYVENLDNQRVPIASNLRESTQGDYPYYGASGVIDTINDFTHDGEFVLIGEDGANLLTRSKPIAFLTTGKIWVNNHAHVLRCSADYPNDYLCFFINAIDLAPYVTGSAQPKLAQKNMNRIPIAVPPLAEQQEIVRQVNHYFTLADALEARLEQATALVEQLPQALLARAFRGELVPQHPTDEPAAALLARLRAAPAAPAKGKRGRPAQAAPLFE